jgi:hypothetical protein
MLETGFWILDAGYWMENVCEENNFAILLDLC